MTFSTLAKPAAAGVMFAAASSAPAGAILPPTWEGAGNSVHAVFDWVSIDQTDWNTTEFFTGPSPYQLHSTQPGASDNGVDTVVLLPNFIDPLPQKFIRIGLEFDGNVDGSLIDFKINAFDSAGPTDTILRNGSTADSRFQTFDFIVRPNPDWEEIVIFGDTAANIVPGNLLRIEIWTISVPSPGALPVAGFGAIALLRRRRMR